MSDQVPENPIVIEGMEVLQAERFLEFSAPINWLIPNLLHTSSLGLVVGPPKSSKTTLALHLANQLAIGGEFLGFECIKSTVLCICLEGGKESIASTAKDMKVSPEGDVFFILKKGNSSKSPPEVLRSVIDTINPRVVIIDCLMKWHPFEEKSYNKASQTLELYSDLAREKDIAIIFIHHSPKNAENSSDGVNGTVALWGAADFKYFICPKGSVTTFKNDQRNIKSSEAISISINRDKGSVTVLRPSVDEQEFQMRNKIIQLLHEAPGPVKDSEIKRLITGKTEFKVKAIQSLIRDGVLEKIELSGKGKPLAYRLIWTLENFQLHEQAMSVETLPSLDHLIADTNLTIVSEQ